MNKLLSLKKSISSLFSENENLEVKIESEDFSEVKIVLKLSIEKIPNQTDYVNILALVNSWDNIHISIKKDGEVVDNFTNRSDDHFQNTISSMLLVIGDTIELIFTIEKNRKKLYLVSIYCIDSFIFYLNNLSFFAFTKKIEREINQERIIFHHTLVKKDVKFTDSIFFSNNDTLGSQNGLDINFRNDRKKSISSLSHWENSPPSLLPEDLFPNLESGIDSKLIKIFKKVGLIYSAMCFFDYLSVNENYLNYKINGYKTFNERINTSSINNAKVSLTAGALMFEIYQWAYRGGNTIDKVSIARNIISLNFEPSTLKLSKTTFHAISSNYKIYERQNVKQYIEVRNKLSEILVDLQGKIDKIVSGFLGDYKKNILTLVSFFASIIVVKVISKGNFINGFTPEVLVLSYCFLLISLGLLLYSRWEFKNRTSMFKKHYSQLKNRYKDLLSEEEIIVIFDDCNPDNSNSFIDDQRKIYTWLWAGSILTLAIGLVIIGCINHITF